MANKYMDSTILDKALHFAVDAHANTERRGKGFPYIVHPLEAVAIVATITPDQEMLAAAALHDVVEDTDISIDTIREEFGDRVACLVDSESEQKVEGKSETESWHERKQAAINRLANASHDAKIIAMGDKLSNMRAIYRDYNEIGDELWKIFHAKDPKDHEWHYRGLLKSLKELADTFAYKEFEELVDKVFGKTK
ncbi:MAG: HD domain-containing protein [Bacteroidaceae bacterium]|nr:HD domain-containing protein [Bacteroidaceae bacterium]